MTDHIITESLSAHQSSMQSKAGGLQPPPNQNLKKKTKDFVNMMMSMVLCDSPFSQNNPLKSTDVHWNFEVLDRIRNTKKIRLCDLN